MAANSGSSGGDISPYGDRRRRRDPAVMPPPLLLLLFLAAAPPLRRCSAAASTSLVGINYGLVADDLPSPSHVAPLLASLNAGRVRLYDADQTALAALSAAGLEIVVGVPDRFIPNLSGDPSGALTWVKTYLSPHLPAAKIIAVTVGNEVLTGNGTVVLRSLVPAMKSLRSALDAVGLRGAAVTTAHSLAVLAASFPPSSGRFREDLMPYIVPLLEFLAGTGAPFFINAYPYFAYRDDPKGVSLSFAVFEKDAGVVDAGTGLRYDNMLEAQVDAVYAAIAGAGGGRRKVEVMVSETGWPSAGDAGEHGATAGNAAKYNGNLMRMVAEGKGTPARPGVALGVYVFALFNENLKPGPASERNYGLFRPDGTPAYELGVGFGEAPPPLGAGPPAAAAESGGSDSLPSTGFYSFSTAAERRRWRIGQTCSTAAAAAAIMLF